MSVTFITSDFKRVQADRSILEHSSIIKDMLEDLDDESEDIPLPTINAKVLTKMLEYCSFHNNSHLEREIEGFNKKFVNTIDTDFIFELIQGANFLNIKSMLDVLCKAIADKIKGKTPEEIRKVFGIENEITPEEEEIARREHSWAFSIPVEDY
ncbi:SKP1-like protein [Paramecium bursaria Chlorella virus NY2B]|nr:SKP1-like protein [Paramecium bursaria Chlorella virus NY2B]